MARKAAAPPVPEIPGVVSQRYAEFVAFDDLTPHPMNPNKSDVSLLEELLTANGFAGAILAQEGSGVIIDGEHRMKAARKKGMTGGPVIYLDVDDDTRDRLLASWNESTRRGVNDEAKVVQLLRGLQPAPKGLTGTGYTEEAVASIVHRLAAAGKFDVTGEWEGMPRFQNPGKMSAYTCVVHFPSHQDAAAFFKLIDRPLTRTLWWPEHDGHVGFPSHADEVHDPQAAAQ